LLRPAETLQPVYGDFVMIRCVMLVLSLLLAWQAYAGDARPVPENQRTFWFGNTWGGRDRKFMAMGVHDICVLPDGRIIANTPWEEGGRAIAFCKDGDAVGRAAPHCMVGGLAVTADDKHIFALRSERKLNENDPPWHGVSRFTLDGTPAGWPGAEGRKRNMLFINPPAEQGGQQLTGVAVRGGELFLADPQSLTIKVFDSTTMARKREFGLTPEADSPRKMIADKTGTLWIVQEGNAAFRIRAYSLDGKYQSREITGVEKPSALAIDPEGRLLACDIGKAQNIRFYDVAGPTPKLVDTFGQEGGVYRAQKPGDATQPDRFCGPAGVGVDAAGNLYVADQFPDMTGWGAKLKAFDPQGTHLWTLEGLEFVDGADLDPADLTMAYTKDSAYKLDYGVATGEGWPHAGWEHVAWTVDPFRYPNDPRLHVRQEGPKVFRHDGKLFLACSFGDGWTTVYRFDGLIAVPAAMFCAGPQPFPPNNPITDRAWLWMDKNGFDIDGRGGRACVCRLSRCSRPRGRVRLPDPCIQREGRLPRRDAPAGPRSGRHLDDRLPGRRPQRAQARRRHVRRVRGGGPAGKDHLLSMEASRNATGAAGRRPGESAGVHRRRRGRAAMEAYRRCRDTPESAARSLARALHPQALHETRGPFQRNRNRCLQGRSPAGRPRHLRGLRCRRRADLLLHRQRGE